MNYFTELFKPFGDLAKEIGEMELAAIWITDPVHVIDGQKHCRFASGDRIRIDNGQVTDGVSNATVIGCYGTLDNSVLKMMLKTDDDKPLLINL